MKRTVHVFWYQDNATPILSGYRYTEQATADKYAPDYTYLTTIEVEVPEYTPPPVDRKADLLKRMAELQLELDGLGGAV